MITLLVVAVATGAAGFFAGTKYQQSKQSSFARQFANGQGLRGQGAGVRGGFRPVSGEIIKVDDASITVKLTDGSSKIVLLNNNTHISKATDATKADLTTGMTVAVFGNENSDGSVTAQNVQLNPQLQIRNGATTPSQNQKSPDAPVQ